ncbi:MAG: hypothetical protein AB8C46_26170 [Burkholderiaceae bacterium]
MTTRTTGISSLMLAVIAGAGLIASLSVPLPATAAQSMPYDLDPGLAAKLAKEKVKQRGPRRRSAHYGSRNSGSNAGGGSDGCGQVDIGNSNSSGQRQTAAERFRERNRTVIVTGPVINAARCR